MGNTYFISDHHLGHDNILKFTDDQNNLIRPNFDGVDHMNEYMIETHNEIVKPEDTVYFGGDVTFKKKDLALVGRMNGKKILIRGNHDKCAKIKDYLEYFKDVIAVKCYNDHGIIVSHYPIHKDSLWQHRRGRPIINVHGHTHQNVLDDPQYINMCVEVLNYRPIDFDQLVNLAETNRGIINVWKTE